MMLPRDHFRRPKALVLPLALIAALAISATAFAQTNPAPQSLPYSQDFSTLPYASTTYPAGLQGWKLGATGTSYLTNAPTQDKPLTASSSASTTTNGILNFNSKIGPLSTGADNCALVVALNTTGSSNIIFSYNVGTIRNHQDATNTRTDEITTSR